MKNVGSWISNGSLYGNNSLLGKDSNKKDFSSEVFELNTNSTQPIKGAFKGNQESQNALQAYSEAYHRLGATQDVANIVSPKKNVNPNDPTGLLNMPNPFAF